MVGSSPLLPSNTFKENLSSYQIADILDNLLFEALRPLVEHTQIVSHWLAEMLPLIISDGRRRVSTLPQDKLINLVFIAIMTTDPVRQLALIQQMRLERNQIFYLVGRVQEISNSYLADMLIVLQTSSQTRRTRYTARLQVVEETLGTTRDHWHQALLTCAYWLDLALAFKRMIAEKYYKLAFKKAVEAEYTTGLDVSVADLYNNYILAIYRAIDKYDSSRGMLASYIGLWFKNASSNPDFDHEVNIAFVIPASQRRIFQKQNWTDRKGSAIMNFANPIDDQVLDEHAEISESLELVEQLGTLGQQLSLNYFMLLTNIPYKLSKHECKMLQHISEFEKNSSLQIKD